MFDQVEQQVRACVAWLRLLVEALGALVIAVGIVLVVIALVRRLLSREGGSFSPIRLAFARYLTLALELQLAADILSTSVAPSWDQIGKLAAIAVIRTALNYFLNKEMEHESAIQEPGKRELERRPAGGAG
ncbi:DUF1622 domain-containing protein [Massilia consociata]|uniref:DUF1622 domain-containing protein n=1 Tax=Massilia consociata TaxID=760117 RepID=A0ABV6FJH6_9BURK